LGTEYVAIPADSETARLGSGRGIVKGIADTGLAELNLDKIERGPIL
jgi:hypothetical protein